ncbi:MAG: hypothetical protein NZ908_02545, partial [Candidatus Micrarchaeota archaeon]|nr:hypothetical protein [Candidatus Micrarchaeota archaeon]
DTRARISFDQSLEIDAELSILGIGVLTIKYIELDDSGYFRYRIMNYGREIRFTPIGYVRDYLDREDLEGSISRNRYEIVGTIVKNAFGEETYRKFLGVTILDVHGVSIRR